MVASPTRPDWTTTRCPFGRFGSSTSSVVKGSTSVTVVADAAARLTRTSMPSTAAASSGADVLSPSASTMPAVARTPRTVGSAVVMGMTAPSTATWTVLSVETRIGSRPSAWVRETSVTAPSARGPGR